MAQDNREWLLHLWVLIIRQYTVLMDTVLKNIIGCATLRCVKTFLLCSLPNWQKLLKIHVLEKSASFFEATKLHTWEERCSARAHKLGNLPPETCGCWTANQNAWRNLTAGGLASHPLPPLLLLFLWWREFQWQEPATLAQCQSC